MGAVIRYDFLVTSCAACGEDHSVSVFRRTNRTGHYFMCPNHDDPVDVMGIDDPPKGEPLARAVAGATADSVDSPSELTEEVDLSQDAAEAEADVAADVAGV